MQWLCNFWVETFSREFSCRPDEGSFSFRERLSRPIQETEENLLEQAFTQVTDEQLQVFRLKTGKQRMDSTQMAFNIRQMGQMLLLCRKKKAIASNLVATCQSAQAYRNHHLTDLDGLCQPPAD